MRVVAGLYKGKKLKALAGDLTRPTLDHVKESLFNIIQFKIADAYILDMFAGSGQLGIEALSRGAKHADFCEINRSAYLVLLNNLEKVDKNYKTHNLDYKIFLKSNDSKYDIIFIDPPFDLKEYEYSLNLVKEHLTQDGMIICESDKNYVFSNFPGLQLYGERFYGNVKLTFFRNELKQEINL